MNDWLNDPSRFKQFHPNGVDDFPGAVAGAGEVKSKSVPQIVVKATAPDPGCIRGRTQYLVILDDYAWFPSE